MTKVNPSPFTNDIGQHIDVGDKVYLFRPSRGGTVIGWYNGRIGRKAVQIIALKSRAYEVKEDASRTAETYVDYRAMRRARDIFTRGKALTGLGEKALRWNFKDNGTWKEQQNRIQEWKVDNGYAVETLQYYGTETSHSGRVYKIEV